MAQKVHELHEVYANVTSVPFFLLSLHIYIYSLYIHTYTYTRISNVREKQGEIKFDRARERMIANIENFK